MSGDVPDPQALATRIETRLADLRAQDARTGEAAEDLVRTLMQFYGVALERMLGAVSAAAVDAAPSLQARFAEDPAISAVLLVHGLHPEDPARRAERALAGLRDALASEGVSAVIAELSERRVHVRLTSARGTVSGRLRQLVERTLADAVPDAARVDVDAPGSRPAPLIPLQRADGSIVSSREARP